MASRPRTPSWLRNFAAQPLRALLDRRQSAPQTFQIVFDQEVYLVNLRRNQRARRYTLRIHSGTHKLRDGNVLTAHVTDDVGHHAHGRNGPNRVLAVESRAPRFVRRSLAIGATGDETEEHQTQ